MCMPCVNVVAKFCEFEYGLKGFMGNLTFAERPDQIPTPMGIELSYSYLSDLILISALLDGYVISGSESKTSYSYALILNGGRKSKKRGMHIQLAIR